MRRKKRDVRLVVDGYTRVCLTAITVLLTVLVIGLWAQRGAAPDTARAAEQPFRDSISQRKETVEAIKATNTKLDELVGLFRSGQAKVQVVGPGSARAGGSDEKPSEKP